MSLKAKLEAVIYAAEEPVTLTQLAALFAAEALEWKAAEEAAAAEQTAEVAGNDPAMVQSLPLRVEEDELQEGVSSDEPGSEANQEITGLVPLEAAEEDSPVAAPVGDVAPVAADAEAEARRMARLRDREIKGVLKQLLDEMIAAYSSDEHGLEIREIAGGYRMATKPEYHDAVRLFVKSLKPPMKLSLPALETLAVVAYKQPVTAPEVSEIRGVESGGVLGSLLARKLIATAGRKQVIGRPILYKTTREFLMRFGLKDLNELPSMEEFEKMAAEIEEIEPEPEAEATILVEEAAKGESGSGSEPLTEGEAQAAEELEGNSPSGEEMADVERNSSAPDRADEDDAGGEIPVQTIEPEVNESTAVSADEASASSNHQEAEPVAVPADADSTAAEIKAAPHAQEDEEEPRG